MPCCFAASQVLGKSCKLVPVMAGGLVLGGKSFSMLEYAQVCLRTKPILRALPEPPGRRRALF